MEISADLLTNVKLIWQRRPQDTVLSAQCVFILVPAKGKNQQWVESLQKENTKRPKLQLIQNLGQKDFGQKVGILTMVPNPARKFQSYSNATWRTSCRTSKA